MILIAVVTGHEREVDLRGNLSQWWRGILQTKQEFLLMPPADSWDSISYVEINRGWFFFPANLCAERCLHDPYLAVFLPWCWHGSFWKMRAFHLMVSSLWKERQAGRWVLLELSPEPMTKRPLKVITGPFSSLCFWYRHNSEGKQGASVLINQQMSFVGLKLRRRILSATLMAGTSRIWLYLHTFLSKQTVAPTQMPELSLLRVVCCSYWQLLRKSAF